MFYKELWQKAEPLFSQVVAHPFIVGMGKGDLADAIFQEYLEQDALYLIDFAKALAIVGTKAKSVSTLKKMLDFSQGALCAERDLHKNYFQAKNFSPSETQSTTCRSYTDFLLTTAMSSSFPVGISALLPCFWVYREVGRHLERASHVAHPYRDWITLYASPDFSEQTEEVLALIEKAAQKASEQEREKMRERFLQSFAFEYAFWDAVYTKKHLHIPS